ncbi:response regulator transcription factor [Nocardia sp. NPDC046473]|uniref:response regulator transcription factor n=1 Tax=Nocardia sp. NPDC046473 TaxID=3155733 RepID=UPI0033FEDF09
MGDDLTGPMAAEQPGPHVTWVLVVDGYPIVREGVRCGLLEANRSIRVSEAGTIEKARQVLDEHRPQVVVMGNLSDGTGGQIEFIRHVRERFPEVRVLVLWHVRLGHVTQAMRAGAHGYVSRTATSAELARAVAEVVDGFVIPPELTAAVIAQFRGADDKPRLTAREREVLRCLGHGYDNREVADELGISVRTVNRHLEAIREKVGIRRRSQLMRIAEQWTTG